MQRTLSAALLFLAPVVVVPLLATSCTSSAPSARLEGELEPAELGMTKNVHAIDGIYLAGQPMEDDLALAGREGFQSVLNLRKDGEMSFDEAAAAKGAGLDYVHLPWNGPDELTDEVFAEGRHLLNTLPRPMLFHCGSANRVGAMWIPWRVLDGGATVDEAVAEARTIGLKTDAYEAKARDYVERNR